MATRTPSKPTAQVARLKTILGGSQVLSANIVEVRGFVEVLREGLPYGSMTSVCEHLDLREREVGKLIGVSDRTLNRRRKEHIKFDMVESDRLFRLAKVLDRAAEVFGSLQTGARWMTKSNRALGAVSPYLMLDTEIGEDEVESLLGRIEHGVYS